MKVKSKPCFMAVMALLTLRALGIAEPLMFPYTLETRRIETNRNDRNVHTDAVTKNWRENTHELEVAEGKESLTRWW